MTRSLTVVAVPVRAEGFARQVSEVEPLALRAVAPRIAVPVPIAGATLRGYYGHPVARGAAVAASTAAVAATGWGLNQPYYGGGYGYGAYAAYPDDYSDAYAAYPDDYGGAYAAYPGDYGDAYAAYPGGYGDAYAAYPGDYGVTYAAYPGDYGGYAYRSYITGRPTLFPRYYGW